MITGEPVPVEKDAGESVIGGTVNQTGSFSMRAERVGSDTMLSQIVHMVADAQRSRASFQRVAASVAAYFVPAVVLASLITIVAWPTIGPDPRFTNADQCRCRTNYCLSVCVGVGHASVDYGGSRPWYPGGCVDSQR